MWFLWFIVGAVAGAAVAWYFLNKQCETRLADCEDEIARLKSRLAGKAIPEVTDARPSPVPPVKAASASMAGSESTSSEPTVKKATSDPQSLLDAESLNKAADDLTRIKGIGPVLQDKLSALGIVTFQQIAEFNASDIERINSKLSFPGRIEREKWVEQAKELARK